MPAFDVASVDKDSLRLRQYQLMQRMQSRYVTTRRDQTLFREMSRWVDGTDTSLSSDHPEGKILAVIGASGAGKTWAIERAITQIPELSQSLLCVTAPRPCTLKQLGRTFLKELGYELRRDLREHLTWEKVRDHLEANGVKFVWVDELQHALEGKGGSQLSAISDTFKNLVQRRSWPISFLVSGLPAISIFLGRDRQIERRSRSLELGPLRFPDGANLIREALLHSIVEVDAGMYLGDLVSDEFIHRLCVACDGAFGAVIDLIRSAVLQAAGRSDFDRYVRIIDFAAAYAAERGCEPAENIFLAPKWHEIRPENSRLRYVDATEGR